MGEPVRFVDVQQMGLICAAKVISVCIGFAFLLLVIGSKRNVPFSQPIRRQRDVRARVFPRFAPAELYVQMFASSFDWFT